MLYPDKPCVDEDDTQCSGCAAARVWSIGRMIGVGPGHSIKTR
jgi:biotin synthase